MTSTSVTSTFIHIQNSSIQFLDLCTGIGAGHAESHAVLTPNPDERTLGRIQQRRPDELRSGMKFLASPFIACGGGWKQPKIELSGQHRLQNRSKRLDTSLILNLKPLVWWCWVIAVVARTCPSSFHDIDLPVFVAHRAWAHGS